MNTDKLYAQQLASDYAPKDTSRVTALRTGDALSARPAANFTYALFRGVTGALAGSVWSLSLAAYHLVLGVMRVLLLLDRRSGSAAIAGRRGCCSCSTCRWAASPR